MRTPLAPTAPAKAGSRTAQPSLEDTNRSPAAPTAGFPGN